ncbi:hypothetical protein ABH915_000904 [Arthrobacter sp. MW3 TE3886]
MDDPAVPPPTVESTLPWESTTETLEGLRFSMAAEVRWTIACTLSLDRVAPASVSMNTEAVVSGALDTNTVFSGMASRTAAVFTPSMAEMVLASSPSRARL